MPHRHQVRPASPQEVAVALLDLVTVERHPITAREVLRCGLRALAMALGGAAALLLALVVIGWGLTVLPGP
mgnify:CR=1 FL=1